MKKPLLPSAPSVAPEPTAFVPVGAASGVVPSVRPARQVSLVAAEYVDPYLFESGFFSSRAEYEQLMHTAPIVSRAEAEAAPRRKRQSRAKK